MARWEPDSGNRLAQAALELYDEHGFEDTTVAEIAARAGVTERTFFRHFADKREVLFGGAGMLQDVFERAIAGAPDDASPMESVAVALEAVGELFVDRRPYARQRQAIIMSSPELRERELIKLATLATALAAALRARGLREPGASLTAEVAISVFRVGFEQWVDEDEDRELTDLLRQSLAELKVITAAP